MQNQKKIGRMMKKTPQDTFSIQPPLPGVNIAKKVIYTFYHQVDLIEQLQQTQHLCKSTVSEKNKEIQQIFLYSSSKYLTKARKISIKLSLKHCW